MIDFSKLPTPKMVETLDYETIFADRKAALISLWPTDEQAAITAILARDSEPLTKLLQENCYRELDLRNRINQASLSTLLAFATGTDLDAVAANFGVERLLVYPEDTNTIPPTPAVYETDESLRTRTAQRFEAITTAGPVQSYKYHALSASGQVADVHVASPSPANVLVTILQTGTGNGAATSQLQQTVLTALSADDVRPVADRVTVQSAQIIEYSINATVYAENIPEATSLIDQGISNLQTWTQSPTRLGRSVNRSDLFAELRVHPGVRIVIHTPAEDLLLEPHQAAYCTGITVTRGDE